MMQGQEAYGDNLSISSIFYDNVMLSVLIRIATM